MIDLRCLLHSLTNTVSFRPPRSWLEPCSIAKAEPTADFDSPLDAKVEPSIGALPSSYGTHALTAIQPTPFLLSVSLVQLPRTGQYSTPLCVPLSFVGSIDCPRRKAVTSDSNASVGGGARVQTRERKRELCVLVPNPPNSIGHFSCLVRPVCRRPMDRLSVVTFLSRAHFTCSHALRPSCYPHL